MENIKTLLDQNYTPPDIATLLDTTVERVAQVMRELPLAGWGEPKHYPHIIARRNRGERRWPDADLGRLAICKIKHDKGELTLMQKMDEGYLIQYAFPVEEVVARRLWFTAPPETY
jgi:hypothetical protein